MDDSHFAILLLLVSLALLAAEVFVPSGGFIAALMVVALAASGVFAYRAWWHASPSLWWGYVASVAVLIPGVLVAAFTVFPRTAYGKRILLDAPSPEEIAPYAREQEELHRLVGRRGRTVTLHSPGGIVSVDGRRYHSETRGMLLDPGEEVDVVAVKGNRVVIRLADARPADAGPADAGPAEAGPAESDLPVAAARDARPAPGEAARGEVLDPFSEESGSEPPGSEGAGGEGPSRPGGPRPV